MGVIYVVVEALKLGYSPEDPEWANLGQGQPEVGPIEGAPERISTFDCLPEDHAYGPVEGLPEIREAVASHYNRLYRRGMRSQYSVENVVMAAGGRTTLTRAAAALSDVRLGYFIPDYTAYEDLLTAFKQIHPVLIELDPKTGFSISVDDLKRKVVDEKLAALLISNPCNPTGRAISGAELESWVSLARETSCTMLLDEYYSHYIWEVDRHPADHPVSAAAYVEDVDSDPIVLFDGLTKNFRYPGWRCGWVIGPKDMVRNITAAGSFVDGGPPRPIQRAALQVLEPERADQETAAVRTVFRKKRDLLVSSLKEIGVEFPLEPQSTFYAFGSIAKLPEPLNDGMSFFREALQNKVLTVPGEFFDVNPNKTRSGPSPYRQFIRFSYGPPMDVMAPGLERLKQMVESA